MPDMRYANGFSENDYLEDENYFPPNGYDMYTLSSSYESITPRGIVVNTLLYLMDINNNTLFIILSVDYSIIDNLLTYIT